MTSNLKGWAIEAELLERFMQIAEDTKKEFSYIKETGKWSWNNRGDLDSLDAHIFDTFWGAVCDAVYPYVEVTLVGSLNEKMLAALKAWEAFAEEAKIVPPWENAGDKWAQMMQKPVRLTKEALGAPSTTPAEEIPAEIQAVINSGALCDDALDELVHDCVSEIASDINNEGIDSQIRYLREQGFSWKYIREALGG